MVLFWPKCALETAARGEVGDVEDAGSDTPWQPAEARPYGVLTAGPARSPHCTRALSRRAVGTPRAGAEDRDPGGCPAHWRSRAVSPVVSGVPGGDSCTRVQCAGVATLPPSREERGLLAGVSLGLRMVRWVLARPAVRSAPSPLLTRCIDAAVRLPSAPSRRTCQYLTDPSGLVLV